MKLIKRVTALFLCFLMLSSGPVSALAQTSVSGNDVVNETATTVATEKTCDECGSSDEHIETCSLYEAPADENACNCGKDAPENIADHADSCPRKQYIKALFDGKTAEEIYAQWETYDVTTQTDLLNMLQVWDSMKYEELNKLIKDGQEDFPAVKIGDISFSIAVPEGAFPEGTKSSVSQQDANDFRSTIESVLKGLNPDSNILELLAMDISFDCYGVEVQPSVPVTLTFEISADDIPSGTESAYVFHIDNSGRAEIVGEFPDISTSTDLSLEVDADNFSSYVIGLANQKYSAALLKDNLPEGYSIREFPVTLFDFDATTFNENFTGDYLKFWGGGNNTFMPNDGEDAATQGIMKDTLVNGLPSMVYGTDNAAAIFGIGDYSGKTVYRDKKMEFVYNQSTGYYEYNSSLNHAQLNGDTVQLYTDTLGPYNFTQTVELTKFKSLGNTDISTSNGVLTCQTNGSDPKFEATGLNYDLGKYSNLYIRMYSEITEVLQVFLNISGYTEANSVKLTMRAGWNEYYFDLTNLSGTVTGIRIDPGNSSGKIFQISKVSFIGNTDSTALDDMTYSGFYPFESIQTSYPNQYKGFDMDTWKNNFANGTVNTVATRSMYNEYLDKYENTPYEKFHFGMMMETNFYIPQSKQVNGKDIIFEFRGDDDLWVYVDGKLALDIGGAHTAISGSINFTTGTVSVSKARSLTSSTTTTEESTYSGILAEVLRTPGDHTIKIFYLERASTASNCRIKFNLPAVPTGDVSVSKTVAEKDGYQLQDELTFTFKAEVNGSVCANERYTVLTKDASGNTTGQTSGETDDQGKFMLKHNQTAYFDNIAENSSVKITEITPANTDYSVYVGTTVNGATALTATGTTSANGIVAFNYVNTYSAVRNTDITIYKIANGISADVNVDETQSFVFHVKGADENTKDVDITVIITIPYSSISEGNGVGSVTIKDVPIGKYTVTEDDDWSWRYTVTAESVTKTVDVDATSENNKFSFINNRTDSYWLSGDSYCENWWGGEDGIVKRDENNEVMDE